MITAAPTSAACSHCDGTGTCPFPFCARCEAYGEEPAALLSPTDCMPCLGMGVIPDARS